MKTSSSEPAISMKTEDQKIRFYYYKTFYKVFNVTAL